MRAASDSHSQTKAPVITFLFDRCQISRQQCAQQLCEAQRRLGIPYLVAGDKRFLTGSSGVDRDRSIADEPFDLYRSAGVVLYFDSVFNPEGDTGLIIGQTDGLNGSDLYTGDLDRITHIQARCRHEIGVKHITADCWYVPGCRSDGDINEIEKSD